MEIARMNYYFTGILIVMLTLLAFCAGPAYPRNEYLNSYPNECRTGEVDVSVSRRDYDYNNYDNSWNGSESEEVRLTFRKYLGNLQCNENVMFWMAACMGRLLRCELIYKGLPALETQFSHPRQQLKMKLLV